MEKETVRKILEQVMRDKEMYVKNLDLISFL
jgi:hypothetical protein